MWSRFDAKSRWPLMEPAFDDHVQIAAFAFARRGGQTVWCQSSETPLDAASVFCHARVAAMAPLMDEDVEEPSYGPLCARATLFGGLGLVTRSIASAAQKFIESEMKFAPQTDLRKRDKFIAMFCGGDLRKELFARCFLQPYDKHVLALWWVLLHQQPPRVDADVLHALCKLPLNAFECLVWKPSDVPDFIDGSVMTKAPSEEGARLALYLYKSGAKSMAETLMATLNKKFDYNLF